MFYLFLCPYSCAHLRKKWSQISSGINNPLLSTPYFVHLLLKLLGPFKMSISAMYMTCWVSKEYHWIWMLQGIKHLQTVSWYLIIITKIACCKLKMYTYLHWWFKLYCLFNTWAVPRNEHKPVLVLSLALFLGMCNTQVKILLLGFRRLYFLCKKMH